MKLTRIALVAGMAIPGLDASAATLKASYFFQDSLSAQEATAPSLVAVDPLGLNAFEDATVFNRPLRVYHWNGEASPASQQAGLALATAGLVPADSYSVEMAFEFQERDGGWRRILDTHDRASGTGFYVNPGNRVEVFNTGAQGTAPILANTFHHVALTVSGKSVVKAYVDGKQELEVATSVMNIDNPGQLLNFFLDNTSSDDSQVEYSDGRVAWLRVYNGALAKAEVARLYRAGRSVSGSISGLGRYALNCANTTAETTVAKPKSLAAFDCETLGLAVDPSDHVTITALGKKASADRPVKGRLEGFGAFSLRCENLATSASVDLSAVASTWNCETAGLAVNVGDAVKITAQGKAH